MHRRDRCSSPSGSIRRTPPATGFPRWSRSQAAATSSDALALLLTRPEETAGRRPRGAPGSEDPLAQRNGRDGRKKRAANHHAAVSAEQGSTVRRPASARQTSEKPDERQNDGDHNDQEQPVADSRAADDRKDDQQENEQPQ